MKRARVEPRTKPEHLEFERIKHARIEQDTRDRAAALKKERENSRILLIDELTERNQHLDTECRIHRRAELECEVLKDKNARLNVELSETGLVDRVVKLEDELTFVHDKLSKVFGVLPWDDGR